MEKHVDMNYALEQRPYINNASPQYLFLKRLFDFVIALLAILLLSPVFLIASVWVKIRFRCAILYKQEKLGLKGRRFSTYKFPKEIKRAAFRKLPLLFNVLIGNMSLVGPQPASSENITQVTWYTLRLSAKPGITGLWQTSGKRGGLNEKVRMDLKYIRERSFWVDLKILMKAIRLMFAEKRTLA